MLIASFDGKHEDWWWPFYAILFSGSHGDEEDNEDGRDDDDDDDADNDDDDNDDEDDDDDDDDDDDGDLEWKGSFLDCLFTAHMLASIHPCFWKA